MLDRPQEEKEQLIDQASDNLREGLLSKNKYKIAGVWVLQLPYTLLNRFCAPGIQMVCTSTAESTRNGSLTLAISSWEIAAGLYASSGAFSTMIFVPAVFLPTCSLFSRGGEMMGEGQNWAKKLQGAGYVTAGTGFVIATAYINFLTADWIQRSGRISAMLHGFNYASQQNPCAPNLEQSQHFFTGMNVVSSLFAAGATLFSARKGFIQGRKKRAEQRAAFTGVDVELESVHSHIPQSDEHSNNKNECRKVAITGVCATTPVLSYLFFILATFNQEATKGFTGVCRSLVTAIQELPDNCPISFELDCPSSNSNLPPNAFSVLSDLIEANCKDPNALYRKASQQNLHDAITSEQMLTAMSIITPIMQLMSACYFFIKYAKDNTVEPRVDIENANEEKASVDYSSNRISLSNLFCCFRRKNRNDSSLSANNTQVESTLVMRGVRNC